MKKIKFTILNLIALLLGVINGYSNENHVESKRLPNFYVTNRTIDTTMEAGQSLFIFSFYTNGVLKNSSVRFGKNNEDKNIKTDSLGRSFENTQPGKYKLYFYYSKSYDEIISDSIKIKENEIIEVRITFDYTERPMMVKKPVIYVYPEKEMEVNIQLNVNGQLGFTYPNYNEGWNFIASPNGNIKMNEKEYNYLFWESDMPKEDIILENQTGFLVHSDSLLNFLESSLNTMGLNSKESADFITFWYPQMIKNTTNHIHFLFNEACNTYAELEITPAPNNIYRVGMLWAEAKTNFVPDKQNISTLERNGFTIIEWGGIEMENLFEKEN